MGLDMYLTAKRYLSKYNPEDAKLRELVSAIDFGFSGEVEQISFEAMYWRKANAIHRWFVNEIQDGVDNCAEYNVGEESLAKLRDICKQVLADPSQADVLLPPQSGFFFGCTEVDEWYLEQLKYTVERLTEILELPEVKDGRNINFYYSSSW
jgi:hypothetical protein